MISNPSQAKSVIELLECPIHADFFDRDHKPVTLKCGHTICSHCLTSLRSKKCPIYRTLFNMKELSTNITLNSITDIFRQSSFFTSNLAALENQLSSSKNFSVKGAVSKIDRFILECMSMVKGSSPISEFYKHLRVYEKGICITVIPPGCRREKVIIIETGSTVYLGDFKLGNISHSPDINNIIKHGIGTIIDSYGNIYHGSWVNNRKQGEGIMQGAHQYIYIGSWLADQKNGKGRYQAHSGVVYEGMFYQNKFHGIGTLKQLILLTMACL